MTAFIATALLTALAAEFNGKQKSAFLRELVLEGLARMHAMNSVDAGSEMRAAHQ